MSDFDFCFFACSFIIAFRYVMSVWGGAYGLDLDAYRVGLSNITRAVIGSTVEHVIASSISVFCFGWSYR